MKRVYLYSILISLSLAGLASLSGCSGKAAEPQNVAKDSKMSAIPVQVADTQRGIIAATYSGTSTLEADQEATVVAKVSGTVSRLYVEEGAEVHAGQALAKLDDAKLRFDCEQAQANYEKKRQEFARSKTLYAHRLVSLDAYDTVKYDLAALKASYDLAKFNLANAVIRAPIDGTVSKRLVKIGNTLTVNQAVFVVSNFDPLIAVLHVPETARQELQPGQPAALRADAVPGQTFRGRIARISPVIDPQTGTFKVTVELHDAKHILAPGMFSRVHITYDVHRNALLIPRSALITEDGETAVYVVHQGKAHRVTVKTGYSSADNIEVLNGLHNHDTVVTLGQNSLRDGARVTIVSPQPPASLVASDKPNPQV